MAEDKGIRRAVVTVVKEIGRPVTAREVVTMVRKALPEVDVLDKSVRAMLTMEADAGCIRKEYRSNGRNVVFSILSTPSEPKKAPRITESGETVKIGEIRCIGITDVNAHEKDFMITIRLPSNMSIAQLMRRMEKSLATMVTS